LRHILKQSQVDAQVELDRLPKSLTLEKQASSISNLFAACGGDDYEICFTAPARQREKVQAISKLLNLPLTLIGKILPKKDAQVQVRLLDTSGAELSNAEAAPFLNSFDHFAS
jgi:thiamine-monophosphate kinase